MKDQEKINGVIRWAARILGTSVAVFVLFFLLADLFGTEEAGIEAMSKKDGIAFVFFPIGTIIGLGLAWKWEGPGGLITVASMIGLVMIRPDLLSSPLLIVVVVVPGLLFILYWYMSTHLLSEV